MITGANFTWINSKGICCQRNVQWANGNMTTKIMIMITIIEPHTWVAGCVLSAGNRVNGTKVKGLAREVLGEGSCGRTKGKRGGSAASGVKDRRRGRREYANNKEGEREAAGEEKMRKGNRADLSTGCRAVYLPGTLPSCQSSPRMSSWCVTVRSVRFLSLAVVQARVRGLGKRKAGGQPREDGDERRVLSGMYPRATFQVPFSSVSTGLKPSLCRSVIYFPLFRNFEQLDGCHTVLGFYPRTFKIFIQRYVSRVSYTAVAIFWENKKSFL